MELIKYTTEWVRGEVFQGKIMILAGALLLLAGISIFKGNNELMRGMLIPLGIMVLILIGYGIMQNTVRPNHLRSVTERVKDDPKQVLEQELNKSRKDHRTYSAVQVVWPLCIVVIIGLYFFVSQPYYKGLTIGLIGLFLFLLILDSTLHDRLEIYLKGLESLARV